MADTFHPLPARRAPALHQDASQDLLHLVAAFALIAIALLASAISIPFGFAVAFLATLVLALAHPTGLPTLIVTAFLFQNTVVAIFIPLLDSSDTFDTVRGANFVILVAAAGACLFSAVLHPERLSTEARRWLLAVLLVIAVVTAYLMLGAVRGNPRDAAVYFRNTVTPLLCFLSGFLLSSFFRAEMRRPVVALGIGAILYGYCELFFGVEFLSLFGGDEYIRFRITRQIETGYWERALRETGFVFRTLEDVMLTPLFNISGLADQMPKVLRLAGPNFHSISFAYALSIIAIWQVFRNKPLFALAALPLLVIVGSKGALIALVAAALLKAALAVLPPRAAVSAFLAGAFLYLAAAVLYGRSVGDYHVLGLQAGVRDFLHNPLGQGLGFGGNLSGSIENNVDWERFQAQGIADIPLESAFGVMLYQMGIGAFAFYLFLAALARKCWTAYVRTKNGDALFGFHIVVMLSMNSVLQEEAFFSPLSLGLAMLLVSLWLGRSLWTRNSHYGTQPARSVNG